MENGIVMEGVNGKSSDGGWNSYGNGRWKKFQEQMERLHGDQMDKVPM